MLSFNTYVHRLRAAKYTKAMIIWLFRNTYISIYTLSHNLINYNYY